MPKPRAWLIVVAMLASMFVQALGQDWADVYERATASVLPVQVWNGDTWDYLCTATVVSLLPPVVLSEEHCFADTRERRIAGQTPRPTYWREIAVIRLETLPAWAVAIEVADVPRRGDPVAVVGFGWGASLPTIAVGMVTAIHDPNLDTWARGVRRTPERLIYFAGQALQGTSGGPIIDRHGRLITLSRKVFVPLGPTSHAYAGLSPLMVRGVVQSVTR